MTKITLGTQWNGDEETARTAATKEHVVLNIGPKGSELLRGWHAVMTPDTARELASALTDAAAEAEGQRPSGPSYFDISDALAETR